MTITPQGPAAFASSTLGTPAVSATGTNGAAGVDASSDSFIGVSGQSTSDIGVLGLSNSSVGVSGQSNSNIGVLGRSTSGNGVVGVSESESAVSGESNSGFGVFGTSTSNIGVSGVSNSGTGISGQSTDGDGVSGQSFRETGSGVHGTGVRIGVLGESDSGFGVSGVSNSGFGVIGQSRSGLAGLFNGNVDVHGNFTVTGNKAFVQAHPTDPEREIVYVALEGGEAGTYLRGRGQLQSGKAVLALPEHFGLVTASEGLTVQLTPRREWLQLYVVELDTAQLVVREAQGKSGEFDYLIQGVRRGFEQHEVIRARR